MTGRLLREPRFLAAGAALIVIAALAWHPIAAWLKGPVALKPTPVAVDVAAVQRADVPVYLEGLGTVQAFYTVTVTARVDGQIEKVAFKEGQHVSKGDLLVQIDPRPYQAALGVAQATRAKDEALLANARLDMERYEQLAPEDLASKQTVDTQRALIAQLTAQLKGDAAAIDNARTQLDYTTITSPIEGRTGIRLVDPGNIVHASDTAGMVVVTQLEPIAIMSSLPEESFAELSAALKRGPIGATALSRDDKSVLDTGTVELIDNQIDQATGTIRVKAILPNAELQLWPGQFVNLRVQTQIRSQVLTIPAAALERGPDGTFTYVLQSDSTVAATPITIGEQTGDIVVIERGVSAGQQVVTSNQYRLQPGTLVRANTPEAARAQGTRVGKPAS
ncbi:MAG TPA: efflux RND transporter periplasmic adaptor subunit [Steroidobacteraceae bacterium]|jgi:multidrug efflux system membrane fusion protein|nr:efflux RND transporter periplasmic adaptor subunit [Steroidobacteraceae bacterium]